MSFSNGSVTSSTSKIDESQWVIQIRQNLDLELDEDTEIPVSIFNVPKELLTCDPDAYIPQEVPMGPYHYWRPEMYEMERYKLEAAKRMQNHHLQNLKFEDVVLELKRDGPRVRACYHKYLTCTSESLAWMMGLDACFMLEFLQIYGPEDGKMLERVSQRMSHMVDVSGRKAAHNAAVRDLVKLENQIPLFVLRRMLEFKLPSSEMADDMLFKMLMGFSKTLSPFVKMEELSRDQVMKCSHLLDVLYKLIVPTLEKPQRVVEVTEPLEEHPVNKSETQGTSEKGRWSQGLSAYAKQLFIVLWNYIKKLSSGPMQVIHKVLSSKVVLFLKKLPWTIMSIIPGLRMLKGPLETIISVGGNAEGKEDNDGDEDDKPPQVDEIKIPSVSSLSNAYVNFVHTDEGILSIKFDTKTLTFHLPKVNLHENSAVVLKNLVAYEACNASGPVVLARYTELMNGIIDTEEDAEILREKGIIVNRLKGDEEVVKLWNGMSRAVRLTKVAFIDKAIEDANKFYSQRWKLKLKKFMQAYIYESWQCLTLLACIALLALMSLQAFCDIYYCHGLFNLTLPDIEGEPQSG